MTNSTLTGNRAASDGGGIFSFIASVTINNSTITNNQSSTSGGGLATGGGISGQVFTIRNSIIANNTAPLNADFIAPFSPATNLVVRSSLIGSNAGTTLAAAPVGSPDGNGNIVGTIAALISPLLSPLQNNGGLTQSHALFPGSPALDKGNATLPGVASLDQRGVTRLIDLPSIANNGTGGGLDMGAVEMVGVSIAGSSALENAGTMNFTITLSNAIPVGQTVSVLFSTANIAGQAVAGTDYTAVTNRVITFTGGGPLTQQSSVTILNDSIVEGNETFNAVLTSASRAIVTTPTVVGTILNNNQPPVIGSIGAAVTYTENAAPTRIFPTATITDIDTVNFANAQLTVQNTNGQSTDTLRIVPTSQITFSGANIAFNGTTIGTFTGGAGTTPFVATFNNQASSARVQLVLNTIGFVSSSENPSTTARSITVRVTDGVGGTSTLQSKLVNVVAVPDAPVIGNIGPTTVYRQNAVPVAIFPTATITDIDTVFYTGAVLTIRNTNGQGTDRLAIIPNSTITISGNNILFNGTTIGTFTGGGGTTTFVATFNNQASFTRVQLVLNAIGFSSSIPNPTIATRTIAVQVTDGALGTSALQNKLVSVIA